MKEKCKNKKTIAGLLTIASVLTIVLFFGIFTILSGTHVDAAGKTYPLKVHYLNVAGDSTLIKYRDSSGVVHYGMIDAGQETAKKKSAAAYFAGVAKKAGNDATLDFLVITHAHHDHYLGLQYFEKYKIHVKKIYVNKLYCNLKYKANKKDKSAKPSVKELLDCMVEKKLVEAKNIIYLGGKEKKNSEAATITYSGGFSFHILGSVLKENAGTGAGKVNNRSMMCTLDYDNYKYIFMGDVYNNGLTKVTSNPDYTIKYRDGETYNGTASKLKEFFVPTSSSTKIVYKIGHHGRRNAGNYNKASEEAMYQFLNSNKTNNKIYCIANQAYSATGKYPNSIPLQKQWHKQTNVSDVYLINGYKYKSKTSTALVSISKDMEIVNGVKALTTTATLGFK